jgi:hypothetical protein
MDYRLIRRLIGDKLRDRTTYTLAFIVGTLINAYGQLLVPWFRGFEDPFARFASEFEIRPWLTLFSVFLAYAFPFCVGTYSAVAARYKIRRFESIADFPERKPDPVFRVNKQGRLVEAGATTRSFFDKYGIDSAQKILGEEVWSQIVLNGMGARNFKIFFEAEGAEYIVTHVPTANEEINIYLTRV